MDIFLKYFLFEKLFEIIILVYNIINIFFFKICFMVCDCLSERGYISIMCIIFIFFKIKLSNYCGCINIKNVYKIFVLFKKYILYKFYVLVYM